MFNLTEPLFLHLCNDNNKFDTYSPYVIIIKCYNYMENTVKASLLVRCLKNSQTVLKMADLSTRGEGGKWESTFTASKRGSHR